MNAFLNIVLTNAVIAAAMFGIVAACKSRIRNPAVLHLLWMLVLLKLLTPPLWTPQLVLLPSIESNDRLSANSTTSRHTNRGAGPNRQMLLESGTQPLNPANREGLVENASQDQFPDIEAPVSWRRVVAANVSPLSLLVVTWGAGALLMWGLSIWRLSRLQRYLRFAREAPVEVQKSTAVLAERLRLRRCPRVWYVPGRVSPMLWAFCGQARIVVPSELFNELNGPARQTLLLHELAHYRRGDHWIRWLELLSIGLYWWHPIAWLVRREIRLAEELACDTCVVSQLPDDRRAYAEMLVTSVAFLSAVQIPALATGIGAQSSIERRLRMIMRSASDVRVSGRMKVVVCLLAMLFLPLAPILVRAQRDGDRKSASRRAPAGDSSDSSEEADAAADNEAHVDGLLGTVVDEEANTVAGAEVKAFLKGHRVGRVMETNQAGQFRIPRSWRPDDPRDPRAVLVARKGDSYFGWLDLAVPTKSAAINPENPASDDPFQIVLLPRTQTVRGTLVDSEGNPLRDIRVAVDSLTHAANHELNQHDVGEERLGTAKTDRDGAFLIQLPAGANAHLEPHHPDWQRTRIATVADKNDLGRIALARAGRIQGRVVDGATDKPVAGQRVFAHEKGSSQVAQGSVTFGSAVTDRDGHYVIGGLSPGRFFVLLGGDATPSADRASLAVMVAEAVEISAARPVHADFRSSPSRRLSGKVLDSETGKPLAKSSVFYHRPPRSDSGAAFAIVQSGADGAFELRVLPGVCKIYVADGNRQPHSESSRTLEVPEDSDLNDIVLVAGPKQVGMLSVASADSPGSADRRLYKLHVKLQAPVELKIDNVVAHLVHKGRQHVSQMTALSSTGNDISFHRNDDGRTAFLLIEADGFATARTAEFVIREQMPDVSVELVPEVLVPVRGRLLDPAGTPLADARVRLARLIYGKQQEFPWGLEYATGNDGRFEIKHARMGDRIQVRIDKPGTSGAETEWLVLNGRDARILPDLQAGAPDQELGGVVRDYDGFAVENAKVTHAGEPRVETTTDSEGKFRLAGLPTGVVTLVIESVGFPRDVREVRAGKLDNDILVDRIGPQDKIDYEVAVTLRPLDGKEVPRATLYFCLENGSLLMTMSDQKGNSHKIGFARFVRRHKDKQFAIIVAADGYALPKPTVVPNQRGPKAIVVDLVPAPPVTLRGRVIDEDGRPVADAKVGLSLALNDQITVEPWRRFGSRELLPLTDADGKFEIAGVPRNSRVTVYVNKPGYSGVWSDRASTEKAENIEWPALRLPPATGELSGRVVDEKGHPVPDAVVYVHDLERIETTTDAQGAFRLQKVPNHELWLRVEAESGEWTQKVMPDLLDLNVELKTR